MTYILFRNMHLLFLEKLLFLSFLLVLTNPLLIFYAFPLVGKVLFLLVLLFFGFLTKGNNGSATENLWGNKFFLQLELKFLKLFQATTGKTYCKQSFLRFSASARQSSRLPFTANISNGFLQ